VSRARRALILSAAAIAAADLYLLALFAAAVRDARRPRHRGGPPPDSPRAILLIPAHDEEPRVGATLGAVAGLDYPAERVEAVVVADNCTDGTARIASRAGATVWERSDPDLRGKGHALRWAFERLLRERPDAEVVVVLDADCHPSRNLLAAVAARMAGGARAMQVSYLVANPGASVATGLRYAAFASMNHVRPRGRSALGVSCGLLGTGMAFGRELLERVPWHATGLVEDLEQHIRLVEAGERVTFVAEAAVTSPMPSLRAAQDVQQERWERGRLDLVRHAPRLLARGFGEGNLDEAVAGLDVLVPPQSVLAAAGAGVGAVAAMTGCRRTALMAAAGLAAQAIHVVGALALVGAPAAAYRALLGAPLLAARKLRTYIRIATGAGPTSWDRTPRDPRAVTVDAR